MIRRLFVAPHDVLDQVRLSGCEVMGIDGSTVLLAVTSATLTADQEDALLAVAGVLELHPWNQDNPAPPALSAAIAGSSVPSLQAFAAANKLAAPTLAAAIKAVGRNLSWYR
ncbi:MAG TPA: hypothetical protein VKQ05_12955 [Gemmatimonadales bacterium]|nr:hypothetical protein [Gemmatimonadales bacterium]